MTTRTEKFERKASHSTDHGKDDGDNEEVIRFSPEEEAVGQPYIPAVVSRLRRTVPLE